MRYGSCVTVVVCIALAACSSPRQTELRKDEALQYTTEGRYDEAAIVINEIYGSHQAGEPGKVGGSPNSSAGIREKHALVWYIERGTLAFLSRDWQSAIRHFSQASDFIVSERSQRGGDVVREAIGNETSGTYRGTQLDNVYIEYYRALSYLMQAQEADGSVALANSARSAGAPAVSQDTVVLYENALNVSRGLTNSVLKWIQDLGGLTVRMDYRYTDDPFTRWFAAAVTMAQPVITDGDRQYAMACFEAAIDAYEKQKKILRDDDFRFEAHTPPLAAKTLFWRLLKDYDPERYEEYIQDPERRKIAEAAKLPEGHGSVLVFNSVGLGPRKLTLDVNVVSGPQVGFRVTDEDRKKGTGVQKVYVGSLWFWVKGPEGTNIDFFDGVAIPGDWQSGALRPGSIIGFSLPAYPPDAPLAAPASVVALASDGSEVVQTGMIASDLDAYGRATLEDEQVSRATATLARVAAKQVAAQSISNAVEKEHGALAGFFARLTTTGVATASEVADTRCWTLLPDHIQVSLLDLPAGMHQILLRDESGDRQIADVNVQPGRLLVVPARSFALNQKVR